MKSVVVGQQTLSQFQTLGDEQIRFSGNQIEKSGSFAVFVIDVENNVVQAPVSLVVSCTEPIPPPQDQALIGDEPTPPADVPPPASFAPTHDDLQPNRGSSENIVQ